MSIKFNFYESGDYVFGGWIGKYTIGDISYRGTRIWFRPPYTQSFDIELDEDRCVEVLRLISDGDPFPGDYLNIRSESLKEVVDSLAEEVSSDFKWYDGNLYGHHGRIFIDDCTTQITQFWILYDEINVIDELKEVLKVCNENYVSWIWI